MQAASLNPDEITYNVLINKAPYEKGIELFEQMKANGLQPNVRTFNGLLRKIHHAFKGKAGIKAMIVLLDEMMAYGLVPQAQDIHLIKYKILKKRRFLPCNRY